MVKVSVVAGLVTSSSPVPQKTRHVEQRCMLNLSRTETSSRWCGVVVRRGGCKLRCRPRHLTMVQNYVLHEGFLGDGPRNHGQAMTMTPELAPSPNYHTTPTGGRFSSRQI
ncbi:uncharacterized protein TNCV_2558861 [Trichonephila clavipes]|nr:uncharacterized protein TNCV_2558861 [Trichonephila clavipes]